MRYVDYTICCLYRAEPPDDEQQACSKHVGAYYWNKLIEISASFWFNSTDISRRTVNKTLCLPSTLYLLHPLINFIARLFIPFTLLFENYNLGLITPYFILPPIYLQGTICIYINQLFICAAVYFIFTPTLL